MANQETPTVNSLTGNATLKEETTLEVNSLTGTPFSRRYHKLLEKRKKLPVWGIKKKFLDAFAKKQVLIVVAGAGSGKSTQIPQFIVEAGYASNEKQIACSQPRRLVATSISRRVAQEMDVKIGEEVGYSVQFENCSGTKTILKYLTDGMLLREALSDRFLERYGVIILDEAHLRTLATNVLFGYLKKLLVMNVRPEIKLIIMTTQFEAKKFQDYFTGARVVQVQYSLHPVDILYTKELVKDYVEAAVERTVEIIVSEPAGDILVFLAGREEIDSCCWRLRKVISDMGNKVGPVKVIPLYSALPLETQKQLFKAAPLLTRKGGPIGRKVVVSTDIAETSLSLDGIVYVIDSGFSKQKVYNSRLRIESLLLLPISKVGARQRSGCARRSQPGKCFRLYTEEFFENAQPQVSPEILRANLSNTVLQLKKLGIDDLLQFDFLDPPPAEAIMRAIETLNCLGALDVEGKLTKLGELMGEFPLDPQMSKMIIASPEFSCSNEILSIAAMLSDGNSTWCEENFINQAVLKSADNVRTQLASIMCKFKHELRSTDSNSPDYYKNIRKSILAGFFMQAARLDLSGHYLTLKDHHIVDLHPSNCLASKPDWVIYNDFVLASRNFIRIITSVRGEWLVGVAPPSQLSGWGGGGVETADKPVAEVEGLGVAAAATEEEEVEVEEEEQKEEGGGGRGRQRRRRRGRSTEGGATPTTAARSRPREDPALIRTDMGRP